MFVFLPSYHGGWAEAYWLRVFDFEGVGAFFKTPFSWITFGGGLLCLLTSFIAFKWAFHDLGEDD